MPCPTGGPVRPKPLLRNEGRLRVGANWWLSVARDVEARALALNGAQQSKQCQRTSEAFLVAFPARRIGGRDKSTTNRTTSVDVPGVPGTVFKVLHDMGPRAGALKTVLRGDSYRPQPAGPRMLTRRRMPQATMPRLRMLQPATIRSLTCGRPCPRGLDYP
jgi:hypothetical protein